MTREPCRANCAKSVDRREFVRRATLLAASVLATVAVTEGAEATTRRTIREIEAEPTADAVPLRRYRVPTADGAFIDAGNELLLIRSNRRVVAFALGCPHRGATLQWRSASEDIYCPKHKARFDADGVHRSGRASRDLDRYPLRLDGGDLLVDLAGRLRSDRDASAWAAAVITL